MNDCFSEWTMVDTIGEVVVNEGVFTVFEDCEEILEATTVRVANSTDC